MMLQVKDFNVEILIRADAGYEIVSVRDAHGHEVWVSANLLDVIEQAADRHRSLVARARATKKPMKRASHPDKVAATKVADAAHKTPDDHVASRVETFVVGDYTVEIAVHPNDRYELIAVRDEKGRLVAVPISFLDEMEAAVQRGRTLQVKKKQFKKARSRGEDDHRKRSVG